MPEIFDLLLDDGDLSLVDGDLALVTDELTAVAQEIFLTLGLFQGEWFLDLDEGTPYMKILGERYDESKAREVFRSRLAKVEGVDSIPKLDLIFNGATRELDVEWTVIVEGEEVSGSTSQE